MTGDESSAVGPSSDSAAVPEDLDLRVRTLEDRLASLERGARAIWGGVDYAQRRCHVHGEAPIKWKTSTWHSCSTTKALLRAFRIGSRTRTASVIT